MRVGVSKPVISLSPMLGAGQQIYLEAVTYSAVLAKMEGQWMRESEVGGGGELFS